MPCPATLPTPTTKFGFSYCPATSFWDKCQRTQLVKIGWTFSRTNALRISDISGIPSSSCYDYTAPVGILPEVKAKPAIRIVGQVPIGQPHAQLRKQPIFFQPGNPVINVANVKKDRTPPSSPAPSAALAREWQRSQNGTAMYGPSRTNSVCFKASPLLNIRNVLYLAGNEIGIHAFF